MTQPCCHIVGAGERTRRHLPHPAENDLLIAADGGLEWLQEIKLEPHLVVGDFDSLPQEPEGVPLLRLPKEKDDTDTRAAVRLAVERGFRSFRIYGGTGGRFDHTLANLQLLTWLARRGCENRLYGAEWTAAAITDGTLTLSAEHSGMISVFCQGEQAEGVTLEGLKYPLRNATLTCEFALGVSNEFTAQPARVTVKQGTLLVLWYE